MVNIKMKIAKRDVKIAQLVNGWIMTLTVRPVRIVSLANTKMKRVKTHVKLVQQKPGQPRLVKVVVQIVKPTKEELLWGLRCIGMVHLALVLHQVDVVHTWCCIQVIQAQLFVKIVMKFMDLDMNC
tara:strand:- start:289 stop:666 length:378 start_codon:yes stop_codon:yes gene_type:complete